MKNALENITRLFIVICGLAVPALIIFLKTPNSWWHTILFSYNFVIIGAYVLMGAMASTAAIVFGGIFYVVVLLKVLGAHLNIAPFGVEAVIALACYFLVKQVGETNDYFINMVQDSLKTLEGDYNSMLIEEKGLSAALEANSQKLEKYKKLSEIYAEIKKLPEFSNKMRYILKNIINIFHQEKSIALFLTKEAKFMKVMADKEDDILVGERDIDSLYLRNFDEWIINNRKSIMISDMHKEIRFKASDKETMRSIISVPVLCGEEVVGVLRVTSDKPNCFNQEDLRFLDLIGEMIGKVLMEEQYA
jgi:hypothetical protein